MEGAGDPGRAAHARRARWGLGLRTVVSAVLLAVLVSKIDFAGALPRQRHLSTLAWFAAALLVAGIGIVLSAWRWQRVLAAFGIRAHLRTLTAHYFAGQFLGNVLPSTIGGDVLRVARATRDAGSRETAFASVAIERLTGFLALPLLCALGFVLDPGLLDADRAWVVLTISGAALTALVGILVLAGHPRLAGRFRDHESWARFIGAVHVGVSRLQARREAALGVVGTALVYQVSTVLTFFFAMKTLGVSVGGAAVLAYVPAVAMAQVLPLSLGGLGVREGMLVLLLHPLGVSNEKAIGVGLLFYLVMLLVSVLGAPAFALGTRSRSEGRVGAAGPVEPGP